MDVIQMLFNIVDRWRLVLMSHDVPLFGISWFTWILGMFIAVIVVITAAKIVNMSGSGVIGGSREIIKRWKQ